MRFAVQALSEKIDGGLDPAALNPGRTSVGRAELSCAVVDCEAHPNRRVVCRASPEWADAIAAALNANPGGRP